MENINKLIKDLYRSFVLRDLLSFVMPGTIVVASILMLLPDLFKFFVSLKSFSFLLYILFFGITYIIGIAVQSFGCMIGLIKFHDPEVILDGGVKSGEPMKLGLERLAKFQKQADDDVKQFWERLIILKQMCGNTAIAIALAGLITIIKLWLPCLSIPAIIIIVLIIIVSLFWGHRNFRDRQSTWETICSNKQRKNTTNSKSKKKGK